jgi:hypothetical protein
MSVQFTPDEQAFRALVVHRLAEAMRPCLDEAVGKNIRERAAWMIVSGEMIKTGVSVCNPVGIDGERDQRVGPRLLQ